MTNRSPKGKRNAKTVNPEVVRRKNCVLPREAWVACNRTCDKKAHTQESAEAIVSHSTNGEGPNVNVLQIAVSKVGTVRNRGYAKQAGTYACGGGK